MAKKKPTAVPVRKFFGKYYSAIQKGHAAEERQRRPMSVLEVIELIQKGEYEASRWITPVEMWTEVEDWWPVRLLRQAAEEGDSEGSKRLLDYFMKNLDVQLPKGVLVPFRWRRGRPNETEGIYEAWIAKGRPGMTWRICDDLAKAFYGSEFVKARSDPRLRKRLRDRVRSTILRHQLAATKSTRIS
jgi:hypothetical protein